MAGAYLGVLVLTGWLTGRPLRPLFDGFAPPSPYHWVNPPPALRSGNVTPKPTVLSVALGPDGSPATSVTSDDGQLSLNLPARAIPAAPGQTTATFTVTPVDAATLGPLPDLFADGNAYRLELAYDPSGEPLERLAQPASVLMVVPQPAASIFSSADGRSWTRRDTSTVSNSTAATTGADLGYFLAGAAGPVRAVGRRSDIGPTLAVVGATVVLAVALWAAPLLVRRRRP